MERTNFFDIPELVGLLSLYLTHADLARCIRISRRWHQMFIPHLWHTLRDMSYQWDDKFLKACESEDEDGGVGMSRQSWKPPKNQAKEDQERQQRMDARIRLKEIIKTHGAYVRVLEISSPILLSAVAEAIEEEKGAKGMDEKRRDRVCCRNLTFLRINPRSTQQIQLPPFREFSHMFLPQDDEAYEHPFIGRKSFGLKNFVSLSSHPLQDREHEVNDLFEPPSAPGTVRQQAQRWKHTLDYWTLILGNQTTLKSLQFDFKSREIWTPLSTDFLSRVLPYLSALTTLDMDMDRENFWNLPTLAPTVQVATLSWKPQSVDKAGNRTTESFSALQDGKPQRINTAMRRLTFHSGLSSKDFFDLLTFLPELQTLSFDRFQNWDPESIFDSNGEKTPLMGQFLHRNLKELVVMHNEISGYDRQLAAALRLVPQLEHLKVERLQERMTVALTAHCPEIRTVEMSSNPYVLDREGDPKPPVGPLNRILISLRNLTRFDGVEHIIMAEDMIQSGPWVCLGLQVLRCRIRGVWRLTETEEQLWKRVLVQGEFDQEDVDDDGNNYSAMISHERSITQQRQVLQQLSYLTRLKVLDIGFENRDPNEGYASYWSSTNHSERDNQGYVRYAPPNRDTLEFSLESGLGLLKSLTELELFGFEAVDHRMDEPELDWIGEYWPKLRTMYGFVDDHLMFLRMEVDQRKKRLLEYMKSIRPDVEHGSRFVDDL